MAKFRILLSVPTLTGGDDEIKETGFDDGMEALRFARDQLAGGLRVAVICTETNEVWRGKDIERWLNTYQKKPANSQTPVRRARPSMREILLTFAFGWSHR